LFALADNRQQLDRINADRFHNSAPRACRLKKRPRSACSN
jgi:hypothetical protein